MTTEQNLKGVDRVYQQALRYFSPAELSEAFAATRGVASPTQLRAFVKKDPRDLLGTFRALAPPRAPITLQRWGPRRVALALAVPASLLLIWGVAGDAFFPAEDIGAHPPLCGTSHAMILAAQAVPSAAQLPCVSDLPSGWQIGGADIASGRSVFWLDSDQAGPRAVTVTLSAACDVAGNQPEPSDRPGTRRFDLPPAGGTRFTGLRIYTFPGGCVSYRFDFAPGASQVLATAVDSGVGFMSRAVLVRYVRNHEDQALCGRGAACPG